MALSAKTIDESRSREGALAMPRSDERLLGPGPDVAKPDFISNGWLFLRILVFAAAVPYLLRLKLSRVAEILEPGSEPTKVKENRVMKIAGYVERAIRHGSPLVRPGCLTRGLTRYYFLRRAGLDVVLCFGMGGSDSNFMGHCWLEKDGTPFLEGEDTSRYVEMYRVSRAAARTASPSGTSA